MFRTRKQSSTSYPISVLMVSSTDHVTPQTGKTVTCTISKSGGAFASASGTVSEISAGVYSIAGNATDRNTLGTSIYKFSATGCDDAFVAIEVVPYDVFDAVDAQTVKVGPSGSGTAQTARDLGANADTSGTTTLLSRLTSARAGYIDKLNVAGTLAQQGDAMALTTAERQKLTGATITTFVQHTGDNDVSGAAAKAAIQAATPGTLIRLSAGVFTVEPELSIPDGVTVQGAGRKATTIEFNNGGGGGSRDIVTGSNVLVRDVTLRENFDAFILNWIGSGGVDGIEFRNVDFVSANFECVSLAATSPCEVRFTDCLLSSYNEWGAVFTGAAHTIHMTDVTTWTANSSITDYKGVAIYDGTKLYATRLAVTTTYDGSGGEAIRVVGNSQAYLVDCRFNSGAVAIVDSDGTVLAINCEFDRSKVTGSGALVDRATAATQATSAATNTTDLPSMIAAGQFTSAALENAPTGGGGDSITVEQNVIGGSKS